MCDARNGSEQDAADQGVELARDLIGRVREALGARYNVITSVGRGGNATLFGAYDEQGQKVAIKVLDALAHAHEHGLAHRDIKPDNIVCSGESGAILVDFGIARAIATSGEDRVTRSGFVVGTEEFMSPEQAGGSPDIDGRTDIYSLGVVLFEALAGRPPFSAASAAAVLDMQQHAPPPDLRKLRRDVPRAWSDTVMKSRAKAREARWQTASDMRRALLPFAPVS